MQRLIQNMHPLSSVSTWTFIFAFIRLVYWRRLSHLGGVGVFVKYSYLNTLYVAVARVVYVYAYTINYDIKWELDKYKICQIAVVFIFPDKEEAGRGETWPAARPGVTSGQERQSASDCLSHWTGVTLRWTTNWNTGLVTQYQPCPVCGRLTRGGKNKM